MRRQLQQRFYRLSLREQVLLTSFLLVILVLWLGGSVRQLRLQVQTYQAQAAVLEAQEQTFQLKPIIDQALADTREQFDASKTRNSAELTGRIDYLLRQNNIQPRDYPTRPQEGDVFNLYDMRLELDRVRLEQLLDFEAQIRAESPYINLESLRIRKDQGNQELIDVTMHISSFELKQ